MICLNLLRSAGFATLATATVAAVGFFQIFACVIIGINPEVTAHGSSVFSGIFHVDSANENLPLTPSVIMHLIKHYFLQLKRTIFY